MKEKAPSSRSSLQSVRLAVRIDHRLHGVIASAPVSFVGAGVAAAGDGASGKGQEAIAWCRLVPRLSELMKSQVVESRVCDESFLQSTRNR